MHIPLVSKSKKVKIISVSLYDTNSILKKVKLTFFYTLRVGKVIFGELVISVISFSIRLNCDNFNNTNGYAVSEGTQQTRLRVHLK